MTQAANASLIGADIFIDRIIPGAPLGPIESHLIVFRDLDWIGTPGRITGFTFDTTLTGMDRNRISFTDDGVTVNYADLNFAGGEYLDIFLETSHVPIPAAAWLFGSSLAGLLGVARARVIR